MSDDAILRFVEISSATKNSLLVTWNVGKVPRAAISGYRVAYQAVGSSVVQFTQNLRNLMTHYDITNLHENTVYNVCVEAIAKASSVIAEASEKTDDDWGALCVTGTTNTDSLSVALGSTVSAFLALVVIVSFVIVAKWQHSRRKRKLQSIERRFITSGDNSFEEELQRRTSHYDDDDEPQQTADGSGLRCELRISSGSAILIYADGALESPLDGACDDDSTSRLIMDCFDLSSSFFVTQLDEGQGYGILLPLARASELLPLIAEDTAIPDGVQQLTTGEQARSSRVRVKLQKHLTVDYGTHWDPGLSPESGTFSLSQPKDPVSHGEEDRQPWKTADFPKDDEWEGEPVRRQSGAEPLRRGGEATNVAMVSMARWQQDNEGRAKWTHTRSLSV